MSLHISIFQEHFLIWIIQNKTHREATLQKTAFLFPGQGSQTIGMGQEIYNEYEIVRELFDMAEELSKINLSRLCFNGPLEKLTETINLQPAITLINLAYFAVLKKEKIDFHITAGHSLGEYSALSASGIISDKTAFQLVNKRGFLMQRESKKHEGAMSAVINLSAELIQKLILKSEGEKAEVCIANHNTETQIVISGTPSAVKRVSELVKTSGGRAIPLKVSGAWHSPLMRGAEDEFSEFLSSAELNSPEKPLIFNVSANISDDITLIRQNMTDQLCSPVKWYDSINKMIEEGVENFVEIGPGKVLSGLTKKIAPKDHKYNFFNVNSIKSLEIFLKNVI